MQIPFFTTNRENVLTSVIKLGDQICCYGGGVWPHTRRCDCKYGGPDSHGHFSEQTGCPELRNLEWLLSRMTDEEYKSIMERDTSSDTETVVHFPPGDWSMK